MFYKVNEILEVKAHAIMNNTDKY